MVVMMKGMHGRHDQHGHPSKDEQDETLRLHQRLQELEKRFQASDSKESIRG